MKFNKWTLGLAAVGAVSLTSVAQAEEKQSPVVTALSSTVISGYVDTSAHWNLGRGNAAGTPPYSFAGGKSDGFNLNVVKLTLERPLDEAEWAAGYKVDLLFGPDAVGFNNTVGSAASDLSIKQAYVALRAPVGNGIDFKLGVFDTIIGYEVFESGNNPNYTRSYGYTIEPTQHTGLLASYQVTENVGLSLGVANTVNSGINARAHSPTLVDPKSESYKTYMGSLTLSAPDSFGPLAGATLYLGSVYGVNSAINDTQVNYYAGVSIPTPVEGLRLGAALDIARTHGNSDVPVADTYSRSIALYTSFQATEKLSLHARAELFEVDDSSVAPAGAALAEEIFALTGTIQYDLWANVLSRLEVRWDNAVHGSAASDEVFGDTDRNAVLVAANLIYKF